MSLEAAILIGAALIAGAIVYGSWCISSIAPSIAALTRACEEALDEFKEYIHPEPPE